MEVKTCRNVPDTFVDPSTGLTHRCWHVCQYQQPERSPPDCKQLCPDLFSCLVHAREAIIRSRRCDETSATTDGKGYIALLLIIAIVMFATLVVLTIVIVFFVRRRCPQRRSRCHRPSSQEAGE